ncbi:hypothetical protein ABZ355_44545, partial [Streptomyces sp. NPDC005989]
GGARWFGDVLLLLGGLMWAGYNVLGKYAGRGVHLTASGRAVPALLPPRRCGRSSAFVVRHGAGPASLTALRGLLARARRRDYATEEGEVTSASRSWPRSCWTTTPTRLLGSPSPSPATLPTRRNAHRIASHVARTARELTSRVGGVTTG